MNEQKQIEVEQLAGAELDYWVGKAAGIRVILETYRGDGTNVITKCIKLDRNVSGYDNRSTYRPSSDWAQGGQIIERGGIAVIPKGISEGRIVIWAAFRHDQAFIEFDGNTPLEAAMRAYVASCKGETFTA